MYIKHDNQRIYEMFFKKNNLTVLFFFSIYSVLIKCAELAQLVEQRTENPRVLGSIPRLGTIKHRNINYLQDLQSP